MDKTQLNKLIEVLSVQTRSGQEQEMIDYLRKELASRNCSFREDTLGNLYVTKGKAKSYPCFVAHLDTVHSINRNMSVVQVPDDTNEQQVILTGYDMVNNCSAGIGGDDKCGVFLCLQMLENLEHVKVALFVGEETGMTGSKKADPGFFRDVSYAIQFDSPYGDTMSMTLNSIPLFHLGSEFGRTVTPLLLKHGIVKWQHHPFTDILQLLLKFNFPCLNLAAGYYRYHCADEYVKVGDLDNTLDVSLKLVEALKRCQVSTFCIQ